VIFIKFYPFSAATVAGPEAAAAAAAGQLGHARGAIPPILPPLPRPAPPPFYAIQEGEGIPEEREVPAIPPLSPPPLLHRGLAT
jgi:hypothetical protein